MKENTSSIPLMLQDNNNNIADLARRLDVSRNTVAKYRADFECDYHIIVKGFLMTRTAKKRDL